MDAPRPELRVTVFSDYICPFCYVGDVRLERLREEYDVKVNWCFIELHPEIPAEGRTLAELGFDEEDEDGLPCAGASQRSSESEALYSPDQWRQLLGNLRAMAAVEDLDFSGLRYVTNSHRALLLAEAAKEQGREAFYALHRRLFEAYFAEGRNIGDAQVLQALARESGVDEALVERAWNEARYEERLRQNLAAAAELGLTGTPTFFIGQRRLTGAVDTEHLRAAAREAVE